MKFTILLIGMITFINAINLINTFKKEGKIEYIKIIFPLFISSIIIYILINYKIT